LLPVDQKSPISYNIGIVNNKEQMMTLIEELRARCAELHELETMEPEDVYQQVAEERGMEVEELYELLESDCD
jgi:hypothetical protein